MYCNLETLGCDRMARRPVRQPPKSDDPVPDDLRTVFGQNLRAARVKAGLTQAQLAERTSLTQQYVSWVEAGRANITLATMTSLAGVVRDDVREQLGERNSRDT